MRQVEQNYRSGKLRVAEVPAPRAAGGGLLVATRASLISSGTEKQLMDLAKASLAGKAIARPDLVRQVLRAAKRDGLRATANKVFAKLDQPIPLGYSIAGRVLEVGRDVSGFAPGDRVACAGAGMANHAEMNSIPKNLCVRIPDGITDEQASFVTLGAIALQGVRQSEPTLGERVVVMGLGLIGLLTVQLLKANGCRVLAFDPNAQRSDLARELGADLAIAEGLENAVETFTGGVGADAVILTASTKSSEPLNTAGEISRLKGRVVVVGLVGMTLDRDVFYKRELDLRLSMSYGPGRHDPDYELAGHDYPLPYVRWTEQRNMESFLALVAEGKVTPEKLVTHRFDIARAQDAYALMAHGEPHMAMTLEYPDPPDEAPQRSFHRATPPAGEAGARGVGFIGVGNYAKAVLLPAVQKVPGVRLTRVVTAGGLSADNAGEKFGFQTVSTDPAALMKAEDTDTVFIATRHDSHAAYATQALQAGKHVFLEKPLAMDLDQLDNVIDTAAGAQTQLTVGFNRRFSPMVQRVRNAAATCTGPLVMMYRINAGKIPSDSWIQRGEGGGRIVGEVCHFVDTLCTICASTPVEVQAVAAQGHADAVSCIIRFANGSTGTIVYSSLGDPAVPKEYLEVFGGGLVAQINDYTRLDLTRAGKTETVKGSQDKGQAACVAAFFDAIKTGKPAIQMKELVAVTETTFAIEQALATGGAVSLLP